MAYIRAVASHCNGKLGRLALGALAGPFLGDHMLESFAAGGGRTHTQYEPNNGALRDAMRRADEKMRVAIAAQSAGVAAVESEIAPTPTLGGVADELDRLHDRLGLILDVAISVVTRLDSGRVCHEPPRSAEAPAPDGVLCRLTDQVRRLHQAIDYLRPLLDAASRAI